jgi:hypothetical protein
VSNAAAGSAERGAAAGLRGLVPAPAPPRTPVSHCANPRCATGWLHLWRGRKAPLFEGRWACSPACMADLVRAAVCREAAMGGDVPYRHRIPLGLLLVDQGHITPEQLREAIDRRELAPGPAAEARRLGRWLMDSGILSETALAHALSAQWNCPVFSPQGFRPEDVASILPHLLAAELGAVPLRPAGSQRVCLAFSERIDRSLAYAVERMLGLRISAGIVRDSEFLAVHAQYLDAPAPRARLAEVAGTGELMQTITGRIEEEKPAEARLVRVHGTWWLRLWKRPPRGADLPGIGDVEDLLCTADEKMLFSG